MEDVYFNFFTNYTQNYMSHDTSLARWPNGRADQPWQLSFKFAEGETSAPTATLNRREWNQYVSLTPSYFFTSRGIFQAQLCCRPFSVLFVSLTVQTWCGDGDSLFQQRRRVGSLSHSSVGGSGRYDSSCPLYRKVRDTEPKLWLFYLSAALWPEVNEPACCQLYQCAVVGYTALVVANKSDWGLTPGGFALYWLFSPSPLHFNCRFIMYVNISQDMSPEQHEFLLLIIYSFIQPVGVAVLPFIFKPSSV